MTLNSGLLTLVHLFRLSIGLWQFTRSLQPFTTTHCDSSYVSGLGDNVFVCEKGGQRGLESINTLYSLFIQYMLKWFLCMSMCVCFQAAERQSRGWRQADDLGSGCVYHCVKCLCWPAVMQPESGKRCRMCARPRRHAKRVKHTLPPAL